MNPTFSSYLGKAFVRNSTYTIKYGNTEGSRFAFGEIDPVETTRQLLKMTKQYLLGALHDATKRKTTFRLGQKSKQYVEWIAQNIKNLGGSAWVYKEGKHRQFYIVEFSQSFLKRTQIQTIQDKTEYIAGYFDTDGGIAKTSSVRYYIYFSQKNYQDLMTLKSYLTELGIHSGKMHNPSKFIDPNYWRFFISARSYGDFAKIITSQHPEKRSYLRMKI